MHESGVRALDEAQHRLIRTAALLLLAFLFASACDSAAPEEGGGDATGGGTEAPTGDEPHANPLALEGQLAYPTRVTVGSDGTVYVSDARVGSVFIYESKTVDGKPILDPIGELKDLDKPLGLAVDADGRIYVGSDGRDRVEKYNRYGDLISSIPGQTMPTDLAFDKDGSLYVADSERKIVDVFDSEGNKLRAIGAPAGDYTGLGFPVAVVVAYRPDPDSPGNDIGEVLVACQTTYQIHVFDLEGAFLRTLGSQVTKSFWGSTVHWEGAFLRIQDLAVDSKFRIHVLDCALNNIQVLDPADGSFLDSYGAETFDPGGEFLKVPLGLALTGSDQAVVANTHRARLELLEARP